MKVTIACSVFNPDEKLINTVESIVNQSFVDYELIIMDDGSKNRKYINILKEKYNLDSKIKIIENDYNRGLTACLIDIVLNADSKYIARIDSGDYWHPNKLKKQIEFLDKNPICIVVGCQVNYVENNNKILGGSWFSVNDKSIRKRIDQRKGVFEHSTIVFKNKINYRKEFKYSQDLDLYLRMLDLGELHCLSETLCNCYVNQNGITVLNRPLQIKYQKLAYKSYAAKKKNKRINLKVKLYKYEIFLWKRAAYFYIEYIKRRTKSDRKSFFFLMMCFFIYPPLFKDYAMRLFYALK